MRKRNNPTKEKQVIQALESSSEEEVPEPQVQPKKSKKATKSKKKALDATLLWTRVFDRDVDIDQEVQQIEIFDDLKKNSDLAKTLVRASENDWSLLFDQEQFNKDHKPLFVDDYRVGEAKLKEYGIQATDVRKQLSARAQELETIEDFDPQYTV